MGEEFWSPEGGSSREPRVSRSTKTLKIDNSVAGFGSETPPVSDAPAVPWANVDVYPDTHRMAATTVVVETSSRTPLMCLKSQCSSVSAARRSWVLREVVCGFSEEARTRGFPSPSFGGSGFIVVTTNYSRKLPDCLIGNIISRHLYRQPHFPMRGQAA